MSKEKSLAWIFMITPSIIALLSISLPDVISGQEAVYPPDLPGAQVELYKKVGDAVLRLWIFNPEGHSESDRTLDMDFSIITEPRTNPFLRIR